MTRFWIKRKPLTLICFAFLLLGLGRLNDLSLYTDSTRYLIWGHSLASGKGFVDDTQPEPDSFVVNAPFLAVLLAPVEMVIPRSVTAAKIWILLWGIASLILFYLWIERRFGSFSATLATAFLAFNPLVVVISTEILSEAPFFVFLFLAMLPLDRVAHEETPTKMEVRLMLMSLLCITLLREIGVALVLASLAVLLWRRKFKLAIGVAAGSLFLFGLWSLRNLVLVGSSASSQSGNLSLIFQHFVTPADAPLFAEFAARVVLNLKSYALPLAGSLLHPFPSTLIVAPSSVFVGMSKVLGSAQFVVAGLSGLLVLWGFLLDARRSPSAPLKINFIFLCLIIVLLYPVQDVRFLLPLLPFLLYYLLVTFSWLGERLPAPIESSKRRIALAVVILAIVPNALALYEIERTNLSYRSSPEEFFERHQHLTKQAAYFSRPWQSMGDWIQSNLEEGITIASPVKEPVPFIGERSLLELSKAVPVRLFEQYLRDYQVQFVLAPLLWESLETYEFPMRESQRYQFERVHQLAHLSLYRVHSKLLEPGANSDTPQPSLDTTQASSLVSYGRWLLVDDRRQEALRYLERARALAPNEAEVTFQLLSALAMTGDVSGAVALSKVLFSQPVSTSYFSVIRMQLRALNTMQRGQKATGPQERSLQWFEAATIYWNLGFKKEAAALLNETLQTDPNYFVGLLWGWHYALQLGDTVKAGQYLSRLESIDRSNRVVQAFRSISLLDDTLRRTVDPAQRSRVRLLLAHQYANFELMEEALDETEGSLGADPENIAAWLYYAELFEHRQKMKAARFAYRRVLFLDPQNEQARARLQAIGS